MNRKNENTPICPDLLKTYNRRVTKEESMNWIPVRSTALSRVAYHQGEIYIDWKDSGGSDIYAYKGPESLFSRLLKAPSIGGFANAIVKQYPARHITLF